MYTNKAPHRRSVHTNAALPPRRMDSAIMAVSLNVLARARIPAYRKLLLCGVLGSGVFIITASVLRSVYSLQPPYQDLKLGVMWSSREYLVTALACSAPGIMGFCNRHLWQMRRDSRASRETQHRIRGWPGTGFVLAGDNEIRGRAAGIGPPRPVSLQGLCTRSARTSLASSAAPSELPNKPNGVEEMTRDLPFDEERGSGFA